LPRGNVLALMKGRYLEFYDINLEEMKLSAVHIKLGQFLR